MREIKVSLSGDGSAGEGMPVIKVEFPDEHVKKRELLVIVKALKLEYKRKVRVYRKILIEKAGENSGTGRQEENGRTDEQGKGNAEVAPRPNSTNERDAVSSESSSGREQEVERSTGISKAEEIRRRVGHKQSVENKK